MLRHFFYLETEVQNNLKWCADWYVAKPLMKTSWTWSDLHANVHFNRNLTFTAESWPSRSSLQLLLKAININLELKRISHFSTLIHLFLISTVITIFYYSSITWATNERELGTFLVTSNETLSWKRRFVCNNISVTEIIEKLLYSWTQTISYREKKSNTVDSSWNSRIITDSKPILSSSFVTPRPRCNAPERLLPRSR